MAQLVASVSGVVLGGVAMVVGSSLARNSHQFFFATPEFGKITSSF